MKWILLFLFANSQHPTSSFDYIIVGGGTAGCVLANRLTENADKKVLVIEAGSLNYNNNLINIPAGVRNLFKSKFDWNYESAKESTSGDREIYLCRGKVLGGSSCINVLLYHRGDENDYDEWAKAVESDEQGNTWKPQNLLPYFKKSEDNNHGESKYHGTGGEYSVSDPVYQNELSKIFLAACQESGLPHNEDFNCWDRPQEGYGRFQVTHKNGVRCSAASGFFEPVRHRHNLKVESNTIVRKVLFDGKKAVGVEVEKKDGKIEIINLAEGGEIIMTSGAINSPQILLLSGIGDKQQLSELGIPLVHDLPGVGKNLQDHPAALVSYECAPGYDGIALSSQVKMKGSTLPNPKALLQWMLFKSGPMTSTSCDHGGFFKTRSDVQSPDLQVRFICAKAISADGMGTLLELQKLKDLKDGFTFQSIVSRPESRGSVTLQSTDPHAKPIVSTGYLKDSRDVHTLMEGIKLSRKLAHTQAFDKLRGEEIFPGKHLQSDEEIESYIRNSVHTSNALVGTCKMGLDSDSVVGADLRVHGLQGIRIADASVIPKIPGGQTCAPVIMIAEKAADFIKYS